MHRIATCLVLISFLAACGGNTTAVKEYAPAVPYQTSTPSGTATIVPTLTGDLLPTETTMTYTVVQGDNLTIIAGRFGVTLEVILAANPGLQPTALSVGTTLIIPTGSLPSSEPTPTPASLPVQQVHCWPETDDGLWCFALLENQYAETLENISAQFTLLDDSRQELASQTAFALLNTLPPGQSMPLAVHFPPPVQANVSVHVQVLTANRLLPGDVRYLPVLLENTLVSVEASGRTARVSGRVILTGAGTANTLWVLAVAYDAAGNAVSVRRWESPFVLTSADPVSFDFLVSSVGPGIERVEFLAEARP